MTYSTRLSLIKTKKEVVEAVNQGQLAVATAANLLGLTRQGLWKLRQSYAQYGNQALLGRKRGPKSWFRVHNRTPEWVEDKVSDLFNQYGVGPDRLLWIIEDYHQDALTYLSRMTIYRILVRRRLVIPKVKVKSPYTGRYTKTYPGEEVQIDTTEPFGKSKGTQISVIDDYSRWGGADFYFGNKSQQAADFLDRYRQQAPFPIEAVRVDGGSEFKGAFKRYCLEQGIRIIRNQINTPEHNGKVERFHRTIEEECLWRTRSESEHQETIRYQLNRYLNWYNTKRRHGGLGMAKKTPLQKIEEYIINQKAHPFTVDVNETLILYTAFG
jgi:transposase InsO family protein